MLAFPSLGCYQVSRVVTWFERSSADNFSATTPRACQHHQRCSFHTALSLTVPSSFAPMPFRHHGALPLTPLPPAPLPACTLRAMAPAWNAHVCWRTRTDLTPPGYARHCTPADACAGRTPTQRGGAGVLITAAPRFAFGLKGISGSL